jgi:hypothetical protein
MNMVVPPHTVCLLLSPSDRDSALTFDPLRRQATMHDWMGVHVLTPLPFQEFVPKRDESWGG